MTLRETIAEKIGNEGPITFRDFMDMCLYFPGAGYYTSGNTRIGPQGDFFTSSSVTNAFGIAIARQLEEIWDLMGKGDFTIVEYGAGTGRLCFDIMECLRKNSELFNHLHYCIIEKADSCCMHEGAFEGKVHCYKSISDIFGEIHCIFSNELIDNLPVHQVVMEDELSEIYVDYQDQQFKEITSPAGEALKMYFQELGVSLPRGYRTEINLDALNWLKEAATCMNRGFIITIDYGGSSKEIYKRYRSCGTLTCYRKHRVNDDFFADIGQQDITAHVNFSALQHWGSKEGLNTCALVSQADFLIALGFRQHLRENSGQGLNMDICMQAKQEAAIMRTLLVSMGSKFKVLIQSKGVPAAPDKIYGSKKQTNNIKTAVKAKIKKTAKAQPAKEQTEAAKEEADEEKPDVAAIIKSAPTAPFPKELSPMLATLVDEPFDDDDWEYEIKWDGYRALAFRNGRTTDLKSRNDKSFNDKFYPVYEAVKGWDIKAVIDGEIVVVDEKGISRFNRLQNWRSEADGVLQYYIFDVLWYNGKTLKDLPLSERMQILRNIVPENNDTIRLGFSITGRGKEFFTTAQQMGLEGIMAKRLDSPYLPGDRSRDWLKIKVHKRQEVIIVGYTHNDGSLKLFSSLLLGLYNKGKLQYAGKVGTGFNDKMQKEMMQQFKPLIVKESPLGIIPDYNKPSRFRPDPPHADAKWLKPKLVCEINFAEVTEDGVFRHPSFQGMREDKDAKEVIREREQPTESVTEEKESSMKNNAAKPVAKKAAKKTVAKKARTKPAIITPPADDKRKTLLNPTEKTQVRKVNGKELSFTNLDKIFWPEDKITKRDLLNYYYRIAPYILSYIKDRPQSLYRFPDSYKGKSFYQKDVTDKVPDWAETYLYHSEGDNEDKHFLVAKDEASLLYMVNFGCIEINPWSSTVKKPDNPDWCLLDLDPGSKTTFNKVIDAANIIHDLLESAGIISFPKTSGSTGIHIYIPLGKKYTYEQSKEFARVIVTMVQQETEKFTTIERTVNERSGKLYLDFLQNRPQATLAAPYSVRPKPGATVSMPLHWEEVKHGLKMKDFTLKNVPALLEERGDLFKGVLDKGIDMLKALKTLNNNT